MLIDKVIGYRYPDGVTMVMMIWHQVFQILLAVALEHQLLKRQGIGRYILVAIPLSIVSSVGNALIGYPRTPLLFSLPMLHDVTVFIAGMIVYAKLLGLEGALPTPSPGDQPTDGKP